MMNFTKNKIASLCVLLCFALLLSSHAPPSAPTSREMLGNMFSAIEKVHTLTFTLQCKERVRNEYKNGVQEVKFNKAPRMVYTHVMAPKKNKDVEILWLEGQNDNKLCVNPNGFPYMNVSLDTYSPMVRKGSHHTVHEVGFDYIYGIVWHIAENCGADFDKIFQYQGEVIFDQKSCYKILIDYTPYKIEQYTVKAGENVTDIAYKMFVSDFQILELNKGIDDYDDVTPGQVIRVPNAYARKTVLYIDQKTYLPIVQLMYDAKGLMAEYDFVHLKLNPVIESAEFTKDFSGYNFHRNTI